MNLRLSTNNEYEARNNKKRVDAIVAQHKDARWTRQCSYMGQGTPEEVVWENFRADGILVFSLEFRRGAKWPDLLIPPVSADTVI